MWMTRKGVRGTLLTNRCSTESTTLKTATVMAIIASDPPCRGSEDKRFVVARPGDRQTRRLHPCCSAKYSQGGARNFQAKNKDLTTTLASFLGHATRARMTNQSVSTTHGLCRNSLLKSVPVMAGALISTTAIAHTLRAQTKVTHDVAQYQDHPNNWQKCSGCVQF